jgi:hypothetical protein
MLWFTILGQLQFRGMLQQSPANPLAWRPDLADVVVDAIAVEDQPESSLRLGLLQRDAVDEDIDFSIMRVASAPMTLSFSSAIRPPVPGDRRPRRQTAF